MISFTENTKNQYKAYERQFSVYGNLYLAEKRLSKNLLDESNYMNLYNLTYNNGIFEQVEAGQSNSPEIQIQAFQNNTYIANLGSKPINLGVVKFSFLKTNEFNEIRYKVNDSLQDTVVKFDISDLENNKTYYIGATFTNITQGTISWENMYISEEDIDYEEYGTMVNDYGSENATSKNIFNSYNNVYFKKNLFDVNFINSSQIKCICNDTTDNNKYILYDLDTNKILGKKIYFSAYFESTSLYPQVYLFARNNGSLISLKGVYPGNVDKGKVIFDYTFPENMPSEYDNYVIGFYGRRSIRNNAQIGDYTIYSDIMIGESDIYERYNSSPFRLDEENECKILGFNINEKTDIYYTSLPYNTMTIEVDNEKGYFTDYDQDSIVNRLNTECYVDLFIKINDEDYYKIMTMKFDKISSSDYEKARLSFKSNISLLKTLPLRDKYNSLFTQRDVYKNTLINYMKDNYNIDLICDNTSNVIIADIVEQNTNSIENLLLQAGTKYGDLSNAVLTLNDSQDRIVQRTWKAKEQDLITRDLQLEKTIIKREDNYRGVHRKYSDIRQWDFNSTETFNLTINGKLNSSSDTIVLRNNLYKINDITASDITSTGLTNLTVNQNGIYEILIININGNIGANYEIVINKSNIVKKISDSYVEENIGNIDDTTKILNITEQAPLLSNYYNLILNDKTVRSYIEAKIIGLPYLEIGDTVEIETELAKILITISELNITFDGGLTETIKGYELGWDMLFPSDTLYPSDDLYPNRPIN